jgi:hypothetical protein
MGESRKEFSMATPGEFPPESDEYAPYYAPYITLVPAGSVLDHLGRQLAENSAFLHGLSESRAEYRYLPEKWSIKEVLGHVIDGERIFGYRALRIARGDRTPLASFDHDEFVRRGEFDRRSLASLIEDYSHVRASSISLFASFTAEAWLRRGTASEKEISVRALARVIAGHEAHHFQVIRTKYL